MDLIARDDEVVILKHLYQSNEPEFLALYGRRRVGKTYLIRSYFSRQQDCIFFNVTGAKDGSYKDQMTHFTQRIGEVFLNDIIPQTGKNWSEVFKLLNTVIGRVEQQMKIVLFFDELPWMATKRSKLLQTIDYYWNQYWSFDSRIKLIVCGSSASWIINKIIHDKGGLHNRVTREIYLKPFTLNQTKKFLLQRGIQLSNKQILQIYFITGGVAFYLTKIEQGLSASEIVDDLLLSKQSFLVNEFDKLFSSLFDNSEEYIYIIKKLESCRDGIGERQLLASLGKNAIGAKGKKILLDLEHTGFIMPFTSLYHKNRGKYYRLIDEYTLFYLKWINPIKMEINKNALERGYWQILQTTPEWYNWQGYAFESLCHKHVLSIKQALRLSPTALSSSWRYVPQKGSKYRGAQIDLLFDRTDDAISLCEIKHTKKPFVITKNYYELLQQKIAVFQQRTKTSKQIFVVLISANGLIKNQYAESLISNVLTLEDFFDD